MKTISRDYELPGNISRLADKLLGKLRVLGGRGDVGGDVASSSSLSLVVVVVSSLSSHWSLSARNTRESSYRLAEVICWVMWTMASMATSGFCSTILEKKG